MSPLPSIYVSLFPVSLFDSLPINGNQSPSPSGSNYALFDLAEDVKEDGATGKSV
ncbi:hypothetical protein DY000_02051038 [Brassica cretica]|uniref:Uncharacterized protein n=1 Tax=Brassica cretica TaxID=69181 RepID=A0ABQ7F589_BRACR|nr:hypothetical protein DY000_02051038 [Brassica cretica]